MSGSSTQIQNAATALLVACALILTVLVVRREFLRAPTSTAATVIVSDWEELAFTGNTLGDEDASERILVFSDYRCGFCARLDSILMQLLAVRDLAVVYRHFPITSLHPTARYSALVAECAAAQGAFRHVHPLLFESEVASQQQIERLGQSAAVPDVRKLVACVQSEEFGSRIDDDMEVAAQLGVVATPSMIVGGRLVRGAIPQDSLEKLLN